MTVESGTSSLVIVRINEYIRLWIARMRLKLDLCLTAVSVCGISNYGRKAPREENNVRLYKTKQINK